MKVQASGKRVLSLLLSFLVLVLPFANGVSAIAAEMPENGEETGFTVVHAATEAETDFSDYTPISNAQELDAIRNDLDGKYYLTADIVFSEEDFAEGGAFYNDGQGWQPIGTDYSFTGVFDGNGHTVQNLYINLSDEVNKEVFYAGLFGVNEGDIQNLGVLEGVVTASSAQYHSTDDCAGGIVGINRGTIGNCYITGSVTSDFYWSHYAGGIAGVNEGFIVNCHNAGYVTSSTHNSYSYAGGIAGHNGGSIVNCYNDGSVTATSRSYTTTFYAGGIAGRNYGSIARCYNIGSVAASSLNYVSTTVYAGGIAGNNSGSISDCYNAGSVTVSSSNSCEANAGGIAGENLEIITDCHHTGSVTVSSSSEAYAGSIAGTNAELISNCYNTGSIYVAETVSSYTGGIAGRNTASIINCYNTVDIAAIARIAKAGGIAGYNSGSILYCYNTGNTEAYLGAAGAYAGGIAGENGYGTITDCYNTGSVTSADCAGGIVGININKASVSNCYNIGNVNLFSPNTHSYIGVGGIAGRVYDGDIGNCYYLDNVDSGIGSGKGATTRCTAAQMKKQETFPTFNFHLVWEFNSKISPYPVLREMKTFAGGNGTAESPFLIADKLQLNHVRMDYGAHYRMIADIEFDEADFAEGGIFYNDGEGWEPIGSVTTYWVEFDGVFDGDGHTIKGLYLDRTTYDSSKIYAGLFGVNAGIIQNLGLLDSRVNAHSSYPVTVYAGGIAGVNEGGVIINCYNTGDVTASTEGTTPDKGAYAGGITGYNHISYNIGVGDQTISNCYNTGSVKAIAKFNYAYAGGIAGRCIKSSSIASISNCYNTGSVEASSPRYTAYAGGITGRNDIESGTVVISNCYNIGDVSTFSSSKACMGGITGWTGKDTASNCYNCYYLDTINEGVGYGTDVTICCEDAQMQMQKTFAGFDFDSVWTMEGNPNYPYPELQAIPMVLKNVLVSIEVTKNPAKTEYTEKAEFDSSGMELTLHYDDGTDEVITAGWEVQYDFSRTGQRTVTVLYGGQTAKLTVTVTHAYGAWHVTKAPTCTTKGSEERACSVCGDKQTNSLPATGHSYGSWKEPKAPTCTAQGSEERTCSVCGEKETRAIAMLPHDYADGVCTACGAKDPTYVEPGTDDPGTDKPGTDDPGTDKPGTSDKPGSSDKPDVPDEPSKRLLGDIDGDGSVSATDYMLLKRAVLETYTLTAEQKAVADINGDGEVNATDYMLLKRAVLGTYVIAG